MPTFRSPERTEIGTNSILLGRFKLPEFDHERFDRFLEENNIVCVSKVHHGEESQAHSPVTEREYRNLFFITNSDLERHDLDLCEVLGAGDVLITDYSTVYNDFLFMNKPIIFVTSDLEEYRAERGLALEPYEYWTAGPKVDTQDGLEREITRCLSDYDYYRDERERLQAVFCKYCDKGSSARVWRVIDQAFRVLNDSDSL